MVDGLIPLLRPIRGARNEDFFSTCNSGLMGEDAGRREFCRSVDIEEGAPTWFTKRGKSLLTETRTRSESDRMGN